MTSAARTLIVFSWLSGSIDELELRDGERVLAVLEFVTELRDVMIKY